MRFAGEHRRRAARRAEPGPTAFSTPLLPTTTTDTPESVSAVLLHRAAGKMRRGQGDAPYSPPTY